MQCGVDVMDDAVWDDDQLNRNPTEQIHQQHYEEEDDDDGGDGDDAYKSVGTDP